MTLPLNLHLHRQPWAVFSPDHRYRYKLTRRWNDDLPAIGIVVHHPLSGGEYRNDRTVQHLTDIAKRFGRGGFDLYSLYAAVCTDAHQLAAMPDPIGPDNDTHLDQLSQNHDFILLAWGSARQPRARTVAGRLWRALHPRGGTLATLGWSLDNEPLTPQCHTSNGLLQSLTAAHGQDYSVLDARWANLIADTTDLPRCPAPSPRPCYAHISQPFPTPTCAAINSAQRAVPRESVKRGRVGLASTGHSAINDQNDYASEAVTNA